MKILHLTAWYPDNENRHRTPFIPAHFHAINTNGENSLIHIEVQHKPHDVKLRIGTTPDGQKHCLLEVPIRRTRFIELLTLVLLILTRLKLGNRWWDGVHVHIAWPLLRFPRLFSLLFGDKVLIGEHWSAYHENFHLSVSSAAHRRLAAMFSRRFPVTTVSRALADDLRRFAAPHHFPLHVIPNVVDPCDFHPPVAEEREVTTSVRANTVKRFLMVASWQPIKRPLVVLEACRQVIEAGVELELRIVGDGPQRVEMERLAAEGALAGRVRFLGALAKSTIAEEMRNADALLHGSAYETFSVVCAESISCGTPVLASKLDAISEFIDSTNGALVDNTVDAWREAILRFCREPHHWDRKEIAARAHARFSPVVVGRQFRELYRKLWQESC